MYQSDITLSGYHVSEWYNFALVSDITVLLRQYINIMLVFFCRSCTDIICCLLFVIFIAGLGLVGYFGKIIQMLISKEKKRELYYISPKNISQLFFTIPYMQFIYNFALK